MQVSVGQVFVKQLIIHVLVQQVSVGQVFVKQVIGTGDPINNRHGSISNTFFRSSLCCATFRPLIFSLRFSG